MFDVAPIRSLHRTLFVRCYEWSHLSVVILEVRINKWDVLSYEADFDAAVALVEAVAGGCGLVAAQAVGGDGGGSAAKLYEVHTQCVGTALGEVQVVGIARLAIYVA